MARSIERGGEGRDRENGNISKKAMNSNLPGDSLILSSALLPPKDIHRHSWEVA
jgi:hypothetical protein